MLRIEPLEIFQMIGNSRSAEKPLTYFGVTAVSSIRMPMVLPPTLAAAPAMSSTDAAATFAIAATSSRSARSPLIPALTVPARPKVEV